ncbi:MAG: hypothetical protein L6R37_002251 [Teloschistes peruensis]|nr:MAG: hypothetical protein L6R37_002251 [Teloschistes peruensis]
MGGIDQTLANEIEIALIFERSNLAHGSVDSDPFYHLPPNTSEAPAGSLLKLEINANTSAYTLPPNTALSRFLYQSKTLNGSLVPCSAYVLWPDTPRKEPDGFPIVGWAHGTSGGFGNCAPSQIRNLCAGGRPPIPSHLVDAGVIRESLQRLVIEEEQDVIAVGHSYGGFVVADSIKGFEKNHDRKGGVVHCLVMSAFVGCKGESVMSILDHKMPEFLELDPKDPAYVIVKGIETAFFNDVDPSIASERRAVAKPHSYATFNSAAEDPCWTCGSEVAGNEPGLPLTYLICSNDQGIPEHLQKRMIAKTTDAGGAKWRVWKCDAGHNPVASQPGTLCHVLRRIAGEQPNPEAGVEITEES